jgi:hypothetical protein
MDHQVWTAILVPALSVAFVSALAWIGRVVHRRLPEGRLKRFLGWMPPWQRERLP